MEESDLGNYSCYVENANGRRQAIVQLVKTGEVVNGMQVWCLLLRIELNSVQLKILIRIMHHIVSPPINTEVDS